MKERTLTIGQYISLYIYKSLFYIDNRVLKAVKTYEYELAPYCGFHRNGHTGFLTNGGYAEGDGAECHTNWFFEVGISSIEPDGPYFNWLIKRNMKKLANRTIVHWFKSLKSLKLHSDSHVIMIITYKHLWLFGKKSHKLTKTW